MYHSYADKTFSNDQVDQMKSHDGTSKTYAMQNFPQSSGEIWCLSETQFIEYQDHYKTGDDA